MCCFSQPIEKVSGTSIFARMDGERQVLAYQMHLETARDVAMVLPLPVLPGRGDDALTFVNLSGIPELFGSLDSCFGEIKRTRSPGPAAAGRPTLKVHKVGSFEASFVPTPADFSRLDPRFRLSETILRQLPAYADYGFAVFKLSRGDADVHPMAMRFFTRTPDRLFFPTVHVHRGDVPGKADFDHRLYAQIRVGALDGWEAALRPAASAVNLGNIVRGDPTDGAIQPRWPLFRLKLKGKHPNADTWA